MATSLPVPAQTVCYLIYKILSASRLPVPRLHALLQPSCLPQPGPGVITHCQCPVVP